MNLFFITSCAYCNEKALEYQNEDFSSLFKIQANCNRYRSERCSIESQSVLVLIF